MAFSYQPGSGLVDRVWNNGREYDRILLSDRIQSWIVDVPNDKLEYIFRIVSTSETVTVPAGTFRDCVLMWMFLPGDEEDLMWWAPSVGIVRIIGRGMSGIEHKFDRGDYAASDLDWDYALESFHVDQLTSVDARGKLSIFWANLRTPLSD